MATSKILVLVVQPEDVALVSAEVGGMPAGNHLTGGLSRVGGLEVRGVGPADLGRAMSGGAAVVVVDARAWIPNVALSGLFARVGDSVQPLRVVASAPDAARDGTQTLGMYLPPGKDQTAALASAGGAAGRARLDDLFDPEFVAAAGIVDLSVVPGTDPAFLLDTNSRLADAERSVLRARARSALEDGVRVRDPDNLYIRGTLSCGTGVEIDVNVILEGEVVLGDGVRIAANCIVRDSQIGSNTRINAFSLVEGAQVGADGFIGPYARIRPGTAIGDSVQVGNYVEIKNSRIGAGSRVNHHAFIGDAVFGESVTIGAGTITCNHDGVGTNQTIIDRDAYIGSGCNLVAPIRIGEGAVVGAGSTITRDVPAAKLTLARAPQTTVEGWKGLPGRRPRGD